MLGRVTVKVTGLALIALSLLLGSLVSQFRGTSLIGQFSRYEENESNTIGVSMGTIDHPYSTHMNISVDQKNVISDLISPVTIYVDFDMSYDTSNMLILDHVQSCYPHTDEGKTLPQSEGNGQSEDELNIETLSRQMSTDKGKGVQFYSQNPLNVIKIKDSGVWILQLRPYPDRYWVKCTLVLPPGSINENFVRRRINVLNLHPTDMFNRVDKFEQFDDEAIEGSVLGEYRPIVDRFVNPDYGMSWQRTIAVRSDIDTASNVEVDDGTIGTDHGSDVDQNPKTVMEWDDVRFAQIRDILYLIIPGLFGLGLALLLKPKRKPARRADYLPG